MTRVAAIDCGTNTIKLFIGSPPHTEVRETRMVRLGEGVDVVARIGGGDAADEPVAVQQGHLLAAAFHPELTADRTLHARFVELAREHSAQHA